MAGFVLASLSRTGAVLWVQDRTSAAEAGIPYPNALHRPIIRVRSRNAADALQAMEMGLSCSVLSAVVGEIWGEAPRVDFTATKRLALRAERSGVSCWILRRGASPGLSAARDRWAVESMPSVPSLWDDRAPGPPRWRADLFRTRGGRPGTWIATHDRTTDRLHLDAADGDGPAPRPAERAG
ncbi:hypothetical protein [Jannaschia sp. LMIT008]|uniref:ImuA family protein n=1 Tax=Jannaschia maritima TaxID=3032585 RepID=UPI00281262BE|nr:hypothetical protein [Jannaschia sp. LMIT008]